MGVLEREEMKGMLVSGWGGWHGTVSERGHQECRAWASKLHWQVLPDPEGLGMCGSSLSLYQTEATPLSRLPPTAWGSGSQFASTMVKKIMH